MFKILNCLFVFALFLIASCTGGNKNDALITIVLTEVYFMESEFGKDTCDNFYYNEEIVERLKEIDDLVTDDILKEAFELRKEKSNEYNR